MSAIKVDTNSLQACIDDITTAKQYYAGKVSTFSGSFGGGGNLGGYLSQIRNNYRGIVNNLDKVINYIKEYKTDIENIENNTNFSGSTSGISTTRMQGSTVNGISKSVLFDLGVSYDGTDYNYKDTYNQLLSMKDYKEAGKWWANASICGLSFLEGMGNVVEGLVDGGGWLVSGACSILGFDDAAEKVGNFVKKDISKDLYYDAVRATGLDRYADPNSTAANIASIAGNIVGNVALSVATGGAVASIFGAGTNAALVANSIAGAGRLALLDSGIGMEIALQRGATLKEAQTAAGIDALTGAVTGAISGRFDAAARGAGSAGNIWKVLGYSLGSGGVSAMEPVINEATHTAIYHYDASKSYWDNFKNNFVNDGVITQIAMAGGMGSLGTLSNGLRQLRVRNKVDLDSKPKSNKLFDDPDFEDDFNLKMMQSKPSKYSDYFFNQLVESRPSYKKACEKFVSLSDSIQTATKLKKILFDGGIDDYRIDSGLMNRGNPDIEIQKRISMANLLINNPDSFDYTVENKINLFHGTNANALPGILKNGLKSGASLETDGIDVLTGEAWSRRAGQRNFVSMTDVLDVAEEYSCLKPSGGEDYLSFSVVVGTTTDEAIKNGTVHVRSDITEVGVRKLPKESVKCVYVPSDKIGFVKSLVDDDSIAVLGMDNIEYKFCYSDDGYLRFNDDIFEQYASSSLPKSGMLFSQDEIADFVKNN